MPSSRTGFAVAFVMAIFMSVTGALETGQISFGIRLAYWMIVMLTGAAIGLGMTTAVRSWGRLSDRLVIECLLISVLIAFPISLVVTGAGMILFGMERPTLIGTFWLFIIVAFVSLVITGINYAIDRNAPLDAALAQSDVPPSLPASEALRERLPLHLRAASILALESEDHYLRVHTEGGDALILLRLGDAIREMGGAEGMQVHRGWWVARSAIASARRSDGKAHLTLVNGLSVPVSRSYMKALTDARWI